MEFATKPQQALQMLEEAWERGIPMRWVTGDEVYGDAGFFRQALASSDCWYVLAVSATAPVWVQRPRVQQPARHTAGRPGTRARLAPGAPPPTTAAQVVAGWSAQRWKRFSVAPGEKGPRLYDWGAMQVVESCHGMPRAKVWLLARRSVSDPSEMAYYLSNAPKRIGLTKLAAVASTRYTIEQCFEEGKGETGLDQYEVRFWHSWHRHITLSMMAYAYLSWIRAKAQAKKGSPIRTSRS
jgi:SRSO17 transposase